MFSCEPLLHQLRSLDDLFKLELSMDADSIYFFNKKLAILILMLGGRVGYKIPTIRHNNNVMQGSRFSVCCKYLKEAPMKSLRGRRMQKVGLHRFPNQLLFYVSVSALGNMEGAVYVSLINVPKLRKTTFFRTEETCLLNVMMNEALAFLNMNRNLPKYQGKMEQFSRVGSFVTKVAGKHSSNYKSHAYSSITSNVMFHYAIAFDSVIEKLNAMTDDEKVNFCMKSSSNGMYFDKNDNRIDRFRLLEAIETFSKGVVFSFSLAGCKHAFKDFDNIRKTFQVKTDSSQSLNQLEKNVLNDQINDWINESTKALRKYLMEECFDFPKIASSEGDTVDEYFDTRFYFDIGLDASCPDQGYQLLPRKWGVQSLFDSIKDQLSRPGSTRPQEVNINEMSQVRYQFRYSPFNF